MAKTGSRKRWVMAGAVAAAAVFSFALISGGCQKKETASEKAGREAREAYEKSKDFVKEGFDKTKDLTKQGLHKGEEAGKEPVPQPVAECQRQPGGPLETRLAARDEFGMASTGFVSTPRSAGGAGTGS